MWSDNPDWEYNAAERVAKAVCNARLRNIGENLESAATCAALYRLGYTKGFSDAQLLKAFCEDYIPEPYFPIADNRPTAERLRWTKKNF